MPTFPKQQDTVIKENKIQVNISIGNTHRIQEVLKSMNIKKIVRKSEIFS